MCIHQDDDRPTKGGEILKGGLTGQDGLRCGMDLLPQSMSALTPITNTRKSSAHSATKTPRSIARSHDAGSELTFDNWISTGQ